MSQLRMLAEGFRNLAQTVASDSSPPMSIKALAEAFSPMFAILDLMGPGTRSWKEEIVGKVGSLEYASSHISTLEELIDQDKANNCVRLHDSNSRIILRLKRSIEVLNVFIAELLKGRDISLQTAAETAYMTVFAQYHDSTTRYIASEAISLLPKKKSILLLINETEEEADNLFRIYVDASEVVIKYIDQIFRDKELGTNW